MRKCFSCKRFSMSGQLTYWMNDVRFCFFFLQNCSAVLTWVSFSLVSRVSAEWIKFNLARKLTSIYIVQTCDFRLKSGNYLDCIQSSPFCAFSRLTHFYIAIVNFVPINQTFLNQKKKIRSELTITEKKFERNLQHSPKYLIFVNANENIFILKISCAATRWNSSAMSPVTVRFECHLHWTKWCRCMCMPARLLWRSIQWLSSGMCHKQRLSKSSCLSE